MKKDLRFAIKYGIFLKCGAFFLNYDELLQSSGIAFSAFLDFFVMSDILRIIYIAILQFLTNLVSILFQSVIFLIFY